MSYVIQHYFTNAKGCYHVQKMMHEYKKCTYPSVNFSRKAYHFIENKYHVQKPTYYIKITNNSETEIQNLVLRIRIQFILEL